MGVYKVLLSFTKGRGKKMAEKIIVSESTRRYWDAVFDLIDAAGKYAGAVKLRNNLEDRDTVCAVEHVLNDNRYYNGDIGKLDDTISKYERLFYAKVNKLNTICKERDLMTITRPDRLLGLLLSNRRRRSYRQRAKTKRKNNIICPLQVFEIAIREKEKKRDSKK